MKFTRQDALDYLDELASQSEPINWNRLAWHLHFGFKFASEAVQELNIAFLLAAKAEEQAAVRMHRPKNKPHYHHLNSRNKWRLK